MQWLINLVLALWPPVTGFVWRGPYNVPDWLVGTFTQDGNWHTWDMSAIVPEGANCVLMHFVGVNPVVDQAFRTRVPPDAGGMHHCIVGSFVAGGEVRGNTLIPIAADRTVEYQTPGIAWTTLSFVVRGWFVPFIKP